MTPGKVASILSALIWGGMLVFGIALTSTVVRQGTSAYPGDFRPGLYLWFSAAMALASAGLAILGNRLPGSLRNTVLWVLFALIPPFALLSGGNL